MVLSHLLLVFLILMFLFLFVFFFWLGRTEKEDNPFVFALFFAVVMTFSSSVVLWFAWFFSKGFWS